MEIIEENEQYLDMNLTPSDRASNFSSNDVERLKKLINKYAKIILNKKTNGLSIKQKEDTWEVLTKEFNASSSTYRSIKQLKSKWEYLKKTARKEVGKVNRLRRQTGGGPPPAPLSTTNEWVAGILKESASGLDSHYDGDVSYNMVDESPAASVFATVNVMDENNSTVVVRDVDIEEQSTPISSRNKMQRKKIDATPHQTRISFLELAEKKKELVDVKTENLRSKQESSLIHLKEEKARLEIEFLQNDEKRKQELHDLQVRKLKLEIEILTKKTP